MKFDLIKIFNCVDSCEEPHVYRSRFTGFEAKKSHAQNESFLCIALPSNADAGLITNSRKDV